MKIKIAGVEKTINYLNSIDSDISKVIQKTTDEAYKNLKFFAKPHFKTGVMYRNIRKKIKKHAGIVWIASNDMVVDWNGQKINYVLFVLFGTRPHIIKAKNKKALRFSPKGLDAFIFRKSVHHPGYKGDDFVYKATQKTFNDLDKLIKGVLK